MGEATGQDKPIQCKLREAPVPAFLALSPPFFLAWPLALSSLAGVEGRSAQPFPTCPGLGETWAPEGAAEAIPWASFPGWACWESLGGKLSWRVPCAMRDESERC